MGKLLVLRRARSNQATILSVPLIRTSLPVGVRLGARTPSISSGVNDRILIRRLRPTVSVDHTRHVQVLSFKLHNRTLRYQSKISRRRGSGPEKEMQAELLSGV